MIVTSYKTGIKYNASIAPISKRVVIEGIRGNYYVNRSLQSIKIRTSKGSQVVLKVGQFYKLERCETVTHIKTHKDISFKLVMVG